MRKGLPKGWTNICLKEAGKYINGRAFKPSEWELVGHPIIRIQNLNNPDASYNFTTKDFENKFKVQNGDLLVAWSAFLGVFIWNKKDAWLNQHIFRVEPNYQIIKKSFLLYALKKAIEELYKKAHGTGMVHVTKPIFEAHEILLPPLNEQKRIVAKLDHIIPKINSVKERLERIPKIIKRFRQSVLTAAVTGKLTEKWREEHPDVESAEELLERIKKERERKYQEECEKEKRQGHLKPKRYRVNNDPLKINHEIFNWTWERPVNIADISGGVTKGRNLNNSDCILLPYLRVANVQDGYLDLRKIKEIKIKNNERERYLLKTGDVLFAEGGDRDKLGRGTVWHNEIKNCIHQNHVFKARVNLNNILPEYISLVTKSDYSKKYFLKVASQTVNLASINMTNLGDLPIPICPLEEQREIVRQVGKLFAFAEKLEEYYKKAKEKIDKLPQSVLAKAFRGELVPQDPNDEPAEKLLERIKQEKERLRAISPGKKKNSRQRLKKRS